MFGKNKKKIAAIEVEIEKLKSDLAANAAELSNITIKIKDIKQDNMNILQQVTSIQTKMTENTLKGSQK